MWGGGGGGKNVCVCARARACMYVCDSWEGGVGGGGELL